MKRSIIFASLAAVVLAIFALSILPQFVVGQEKPMPFGGKGDVEFASKVWEAMKGYEKSLMKSDVIPGNTPHGKFIRYYYNLVTVDEKPYHVIIKDNYSPDKKLAAVTVMVQREAGYDPDNNDWFWVKYNTDGSVGKNPMGMALAGRVAKGMDQGCIACHKGAKGNDYLFANDGEM